MKSGKLEGAKAQHRSKQVTAVTVRCTKITVKLYHSDRPIDLVNFLNSFSVQFFHCNCPPPALVCDALRMPESMQQTSVIAVPTFSEFTLQSS